MGNHISKDGIDEECVTHGNNGYWWENLKKTTWTTHTKNNIKNVFEVESDRLEWSYSLGVSFESGNKASSLLKRVEFLEQLKN